MALHEELALASPSRCVKYVVALAWGLLLSKDRRLPRRDSHPLHTPAHPAASCSPRSKRSTTTATATAACCSKCCASGAGLSPAAGRCRAAAGAWNLEGIERVLFWLPETVAAMRASERVFIAKGEKDADHPAALSLAATTNSGDA